MDVVSLCGKTVAGMMVSGQITSASARVNTNTLMGTSILVCGVRTYRMAREYIVSAMVIPMKVTTLMVNEQERAFSNMPTEINM